MQSIFIPTLSFWENGNTWYGSLEQARFFLAPEDGMLTAQLWRGPLSRALSSILSQTSVPLTQEGLEQMITWLEEQAASLNQSCDPTL